MRLPRGSIPTIACPDQQEQTFTLRRLRPRDDAPRRHEERPNHAHTCPFHADKDAPPALIDRTYHIRPVPKSDRSYIDALPITPDRLADVAERDLARSSERNDRPSRLGGILWRVLDACINVVPPPQDGSILGFETSFQGSVPPRRKLGF